MSATRLRRELGVIIRCNGEGCSKCYVTAIVYITHTRFAARRDGWIRGGRKSTRLVMGTKRNDYCPTCAPIELAAVAELKRASEQRKLDRDAARKLKREDLAAFKAAKKAARAAKRKQRAAEPQEVQVSQ